MKAVIILTRPFGDDQAFAVIPTPQPQTPLGRDSRTYDTFAEAEREASSLANWLRMMGWEVTLEHDIGALWAPR